MGDPEVIIDEDGATWYVWPTCICEIIYCGPGDPNLKLRGQLDPYLKPEN